MSYTHHASITVDAGAAAKDFEFLCDHQNRSRSFLINSHYPLMIHLVATSPKDLMDLADALAIAAERWEEQS